MNFVMKLESIPFEATKLRQKVIEVRLNDERRKGLRAGDTIEFQRLPALKEKIKVRVLAVRTYQTARELVRQEDFGKTGGIYKSLKAWEAALCGYYDAGRQAEFGLLSIEIVVE